MPRRLPTAQRTAARDFSTPFTLRNLALSKAAEPFDIRSAIKINSIYELPFGPGRAMLSTVQQPVAEESIEGWELSGVVRLQSGTPLFLAGFNQFNQNATGVVLHNITLSQLQSHDGCLQDQRLHRGGRAAGHRLLSAAAGPRP